MTTRTPSIDPHALASAAIYNQTLVRGLSLLSPSLLPPGKAPPAAAKLPLLSPDRSHAYTAVCSSKCLLPLHFISLQHPVLQRRNETVWPWKTCSQYGCGPLKPED